MTVLAHRRVSPFGHPRINACVPLPLAYRSLPRPSSPSCAQASPTCFRSLDHKLAMCQAEHARSTAHMHGCPYKCAQQVKRLVQLPPPSCSCERLNVGRLHCHFSCRFVIPRSLLLSVVKQRVCAICQPRLRSRRACGRLPRTFRHTRPKPSGLTRHSGKEVIQPQVPLRLPCYDFAPVTTLAFGGLVPCGFRHRLRALVASMA